MTQLEIDNTCTFPDTAQTFFWLQDSGYAAGFSARGERDSTGQGHLYPNTGVPLLQNN